MAKKRGPEKQAQDQIVKYLKAIGIFCWVSKTGAVYDPVKKIFRANSTKGISDILGLLPDDGRILCIEVKSERGRPTPEQRAFIATIRQHGGVAGIARSLADVDKLLLEAGICLGGK